MDARFARDDKRRRARHRARREAIQAARAATAPERPDAEILREYLTRAMERGAFCLVLAAAVILWDALPALPWRLAIG